MTVAEAGAFRRPSINKGERYRRQFLTKGEAQVWELEAKAALMRGEQPALTAKAVTLGKPRPVREPVKWTKARHRNGQKAGEKVDAGRFHRSAGASRLGIFGREIHSLMRAIDAIWGDEPEIACSTGASGTSGGDAARLDDG